MFCSAVALIAETILQRVGIILLFLHNNNDRDLLQSVEAFGNKMPILEHAPRVSH